MEDCRQFRGLGDGSVSRGSSVVPHWIRFCSGFDSAVVCRQYDDTPSLAASTARAKPYAIALRRAGVVFTVHESGTADAIRGKEMIIAAPFVARGAMVPMRLLLQRRKRGRVPPPHLASHPAPDEFYNDPLSFRKFCKDCARKEQDAGAVKRFKRIALREDSPELRRLRRACASNPSTRLEPISKLPRAVDPL